MARLVLLDAGPLGLACSRSGVLVVDRCRAWLLALEVTGAEILIPAISEYEVRRELIRLRATVKLRNLEVLKNRFDSQAISDVALTRAAEFWALVRRAG